VLLLTPLPVVPHLPGNTSTSSIHATASAGVIDFLRLFFRSATGKVISTFSRFQECGTRTNEPTNQRTHAVKHAVKPDRCHHTEKKMDSMTFAVPVAARPGDAACAARRARQPGRLRLAGAALLLAATCGFAQAGGVDLSAAQMDQVAAGYQQSTSDATASALLGFATTASNTYASVTGPIRSTGSTSVGVAGGFGAGATATAATWFR
jgi:hypothetical protein